ncbi:uncharacterized protein LOC142644410 [Castanea sativa]|uniref:uncharacterized protein LOC142644410 n=1 Tax=Castanea sativa TaxID=21020 RepID=UPI003F64B673
MRRIEGGKLPRRFTQPTFNMYNGRTDPVEHVSHFSQRMVVHSKSEALMCKVFPFSLGPVAMRWFDGFKEGYISSFKELTRAFGACFSTAASPAVNLESDDDTTIMDTSTNHSPSLRVNSKSKFKKPKRVSGKNKKEKHHTSIVWTEFVKLPINEEGISKATCQCVVLACAIVLDPRYKLDYVDYIFKKIEPIEHIAKMKVDSVESTLYKFFPEYECPKPMTTVSSCVGSSSHTSSAMDDPDDDEDKEHDKEHYNRFPELSLMARDLMSIPITTVASESSFSTGKKILTPYRSHLLPENVETTLCTKSWLYGFEDEDADKIGQLELQFGAQVGSRAQIDASARPPLGTISVILVALGRTGSQPSRVMSVSRPSEDGSSPNPKRNRMEVWSALSFSDEIKVGTLQPHNDALVVTFRIGGYNVKRVLVD